MANDDDRFASALRAALTEIGWPRDIDKVGITLRDGIVISLYRARPVALESEPLDLPASHYHHPIAAENGDHDCGYRRERDECQRVVTELRRKLAAAGVEGSPPTGEEGTIPRLLRERDEARAEVERMRAIETAARQAVVDWDADDDDYTAFDSMYHLRALLFPRTCGEEEEET